MIVAINLPLWTVPVTAYVLLLCWMGVDAQIQRWKRRRARRARRAALAQQDRIDEALFWMEDANG